MVCGLRGLHRSISQISVTLRDATGNVTREVGSVEVQDLADLPGLHQQVQAVASRLRDAMENLQKRAARRCRPSGWRRLVNWRRA